jgi:hypothetical protein
VPAVLVIDTAPRGGSTPATSGTARSSSTTSRTSSACRTATRATVPCRTRTERFTLQKSIRFSPFPPLPLFLSDRKRGFPCVWKKFLAIWINNRFKLWESLLYLYL